MANGNERVEGTEDDKWLGRPILAALLRLAIFAIPIALSIVAATITAHIVSRPHTPLLWVGWWLIVLGVPTVVLVVTDRVARRALPLTVLLKMTMVFPDRAPGRLSVARKSGSIRNLTRVVDDARTHGVEDEPTLAAQSILALAAALNVHDRLTRGHGERVRAYTDLIADELGLPAADRDRLRWSALLHDIGKLAVHPDILNKPEKLTAEEWVLIKNHPLEGARLTAPLAGWLGPWASTIAEHHEKFDGTGYPFGLSGEEISLGGRIVAVADSYDTMTSVRSYQPQLSPEAARAELAACAGSHFDPKIVRAFLDISIGRIRPVSGPLAWIGSLPFLGNVPQLGQAAAVLGRVAAATITVGGAVTTGTLHLAPAPAGHSPNGLAGGSDSNGTGTRRTTGTQPSRPQKPSAPSGVSSVKAGSTNTTTSTTLAGGSNAPGHGPPNPGGVTGTRPPVATVPTTTVAAPSTTTTTTTTLGPTPVTGSLTIRDGNGQPGRAGQNDQIIVTLSPAPALSAFCSAWSASSYPDLARPNIQVNIDQPAPGSNDMVASIVDSSDCKTGFHFGTIDLGQAGYVNGSATFGGGNSQCTANLFSGCTSIHWDGHNTLTITLGQPSTGQPTQASLSTAVYTPDPALNLSGTIRSATEENF